MNPGFIYLARIIEQLTGDPYQSYVYKNLWPPLGITHSYFGATPYHLADQRSNNYDVVRDSAGHEAVVANGRDFDPGITIPIGGWNAQLGDLARWVGFLSGAAGNDTVLARTTLDEMWRTLFATEGDAPGDSVGLSFFVLWRDGVRFIGHTGQQAGVRSFFSVNSQTSPALIAPVHTTNHPREAETAQGINTTIAAALPLIS